MSSVQALQLLLAEEPYPILWEYQQEEGYVLGLPHELTTLAAIRWIEDTRALVGPLWEDPDKVYTCPRPEKENACGFCLHWMREGRLLEIEILHNDCGTHISWRARPTPEEAKTKYWGGSSGNFFPLGKTSALFNWLYTGISLP